jgi:hypothetical protein
VVVGVGREAEGRKKEKSKKLFGGVSILVKFEY